MAHIGFAWLQKPGGGGGGGGGGIYVAVSKRHIIVLFLYQFYLFIMASLYGSLKRDFSKI